MTIRKYSPMHDFWHPRVEGQIRDAMHAHPEWFRFKNDAERARAVNSIAKRIVGEIVAGGLRGNNTGVSDCHLGAPVNGKVRFMCGANGREWGYLFPALPPEAS